MQGRHAAGQQAELSGLSGRWLSGIGKTLQNLYLPGSAPVPELPVTIVSELAPV